MKRKRTPLLAADTILRVYSDVVTAGLILPRKAYYTVRDVKALCLRSLFQGARTLTVREAVFVVKCSSVFHETDYSIAVAKLFETHNPQT